MIGMESHQLITKVGLLLQPPRRKLSMFERLYGDVS